MRNERKSSILIPLMLGCLAIAAVIRLGGFDATTAFSHLVEKLLV